MINEIEAQNIRINEQLGKGEALTMLDLEVFKNICLIGLLLSETNEIITYMMLHNNINKWDRVNKSLTPATSEDVKWLLRRLSDPLVTFNGYQYDYVLLDIIRIYLYNNTDYDKSKAEIPIHANWLKGNTFKSFKYNSFTEFLYSISSKLLIQGKFMQPREKGEDYRDNNSGRNTRLNNLLKLGTDSQVFIKDVFGYTDLSSLSNLQYNIETSLHANPNYWDARKALKDGEYMSLKTIASLMFDMNYDERYEFDFDAPFDLANLETLINYNDLDLVVTQKLAQSNEFQGYMNERIYVAKYIENRIKKKLNLDRHIVLNACDSSKITEQWGLSFPYKGAVRQRSNQGDDIVLYDKLSRLLKYNTVLEHDDRYRDLHGFVSKKFVMDNFSHISSLETSTYLNNLLTYLTSTGVVLPVGEVSSEEFARNLSKDGDAGSKKKNNVLDKLDTYIKLDSVYDDYCKAKLGLGGLHSDVIKFYEDWDNKHLTSSKYTFTEFDVVSYYPFLISNMECFSKSLIDNGILEAYIEFMNLRVACKQYGGNGVKSEIIHKFEKEFDMDIDKDNVKYLISAFKLILNSVFGKMNNKFSIFFNPIQHYKITITGQYLLSKILEKTTTMSFEDFRFVYANTDGIMFRIKTDELESYKAAFAEIADGVGKKYGFDIPFESVDYESIAYENVNTVVKLTKFPELSNQGQSITAECIKQKLITLKGGTYSLSKFFHPNNKNSYYGKLWALDNYLFDIDPELRFEDLRNGKIPNSALALMYLKPSEKFTKYAVHKADSSTYDITERKILGFYPSNSSDDIMVRKYTIGQPSGSSLIDFRVRFCDHYTKNIFTDGDFDYDTFRRLIENNVAKIHKDRLSNSKSLGIESILDGFDNEIFFDDDLKFNNTIKRLTTLGLCPLPAKANKGNFTGVRGRGRTESWKNYQQFAAGCWDRYRNHKECRAVKVALPDDIIAFDIDHPEDVNIDLIRILKDGSNYLVESENVEKFKAFYKIPKQLQNRHISFKKSVIADFMSDKSSSIEIFTGFQKRASSLGVEGYKLRGVKSREFKNKVKIDKSKADNNIKVVDKTERYLSHIRSDYISMLPDSLINLLDFQQINYNSVSDNIDLHHEALKEFYLKEASENPVETLFNAPWCRFAKLNGDTDSMSNNLKKDILWTCLHFGYIHGTMHYVIEGFRLGWVNYVEGLEDFIVRFDVSKRNHRNRLYFYNCLCKKYGFVHEDFLEITKYRKFEEINSNKLLDTLHEDERRNALYVTAYDITFPNSEKMLDVNILDTYEKDYEFRKILTQMETCDLIVSNLLLHFGLRPIEVITNDDMSKYLGYHINSENIEGGPRFTVDDLELPNREIDVSSLNVRTDMLNIMNKSSSDVNLIYAPTGAGKSYSTVEALAQKIRDGSLRDKSVVYLVHTHKETDTICQYFEDFLDHDEILQPGFENDFYKEFPDTNIKDISELLLDEYFSKYKVIPINAKTSNNKVLEYIMKYSPKNKIYLLIKAYCSTSTLGGNPYSAFKMLMRYIPEPDITICDEIQKLVEHCAIEIAPDLMVVTKNSSRKIKLIKDVVAFDKVSEKELREDDTIGNLTKSFQTTPTDEFKVDICLDRSVRSFLDKLYESSFDSNEIYQGSPDDYQPDAEIEGWCRYGAAGTLVYDTHVFVNNDTIDGGVDDLAYSSDSTDLSDVSEGEEVDLDDYDEVDQKESTVSNLINLLIKRSPILAFLKKRPIYMVSQDEKTVRVPINTIEELNSHLFINKFSTITNWNERNANNPLTSFIVPIMRIYDTYHITRLIKSSKKCLFMTATYSKVLGRFLDCIIPRKMSVGAYRGIRNKSDKLNQGVMIMAHINLIQQLTHSRERLEVNNIKEVFKDTQHKMLMIPPSEWYVNRISDNIHGGGLGHEIKQGRMTKSDKLNYSEEENNKICLVSARGSNGLGVNFGEYKIILCTTQPWSPIPTLTMIQNDKDLGYVMHQDLVNIIVQNVGRNTRFAKGEDRARRVYIIDGMFEISRMIDIIGVSNSEGFLNRKGIFESVIYYLSPQFEEEFTAIHMVTPREYNDLNNSSKLVIAEKMSEICIKKLFEQSFHFLDTGELPDFYTYSEHIIKKETQKEESKVSSFIRQRILEAAQDTECIQKDYDCSFDNFKKAYKFNMSNPYFDDYYQIFLSSSKLIVQDLIKEMKLSEDNFVTITKFLERNNIKGAIKKSILKDTQLKQSYIDKILQLEAEYLAQHPEMTKKAFRLKFNIHRIIK